MKSIVFFNNKGGVGKTTLSCNLAAFLSKTRKKSVLLIDCDPQCNATQLLFSDELLWDLYEAQKSDFSTIKDVLDPLVKGDIRIAERINIVPKTKSRYEVDILPGHPNLSLFEDVLGLNWGLISNSQPGHFRITNWLHQLLSKIGNYDFVFIDVGPSLGAINRSVLIASDVFMAPFGCDIFSLMGVKNIGDWIASWERKYFNSYKNNEEELNKIELLSRPGENHFRLIGYSIQQYAARKFKDGKRAVKAYEEIMQQIPQSVSDSLKNFALDGLTDSNLHLGSIPNLSSLVPRSQTARAPMFALSSSDGIVGSHYAQVKEYEVTLTKIADNFLDNVKKI